MDDAQQIVLVALQQAGIHVPGDAKGSQELGSSGLVSICAQGVALLRGVSPIPVTLLPAGTAERFRVCTDLAGAIKLLGYQGDLSFHQVSPYHRIVCVCKLYHGNFHYKPLLGFGVGKMPVESLVSIHKFDDWGTSSLPALLSIVFDPVSFCEGSGYLGFVLIIFL